MRHGPLPASTCLVHDTCLTFRLCHSACFHFNFRATLHFLSLPHSPHFPPRFLPPPLRFLRLPHLLSPSHFLPQPPFLPPPHFLHRYLDMPEWTALINESGLYHRYFTVRCV